MSTVAAPSLFRGIASLLYPPSCTICSTSVDFGEYLCGGCEAKVSRIVPPFCAKCSEPSDGAITTTFSCANCSHRVLYFDAAISVYRSRGIARHVILNFKYGKQIHLRHLVSAWLIAALDDSRIRGLRFDAIVPVPLHPARQRERGFNQAGLLAERVGLHLGAPVRPVLQRVRFTTTQTAFDRAERIQNLRHAFRLRKNADVRRLAVLLIDDVLTTGSTLSECARVLKENGARGLRCDRCPRINCHGHFQETNAQDTSSKEAGHPARIVPEMSRLRRSGFGNRAQRKSAGLSPVRLPFCAVRQG